VVPDQVHSIPWVSVPAVCALMWGESGARKESVFYLARCSLSLGSLFPQCVQSEGGDKCRRGRCTLLGATCQSRSLFRKYMRLGEEAGAK
jgi:hypothetical protein